MTLKATIITTALVASTLLSSCAGDPRRHFGKSCTALKIEIQEHLAEMQREQLSRAIGDAMGRRNVGSTSEEVLLVGLLEELTDHANKDNRNALIRAWDHAGCPGPSGF